MKFSVLGVFLLLALFDSGWALDCFVCNLQDSNNEKCTQTIMTCKQNEEMCLTEIKWGTTPYWQAGAQKQYYFSKRCARKEHCRRTMNKYLPYCTYVWYEDWKCVDCCEGDKCNYYVISGSSRSSLSITLAVSIAGIYIRKLLNLSC
ncbi:uncharacterized protein LOC106669435 [Cimex lectularius]|uniref:Uncharacterized protein n=1 Tax=Cimex lectularius TaxID=79782 RepID=A0A8I6S1V1_CIMLE|nr:uncharacterized protein LOC106669435 [Cimex lectularius]